MNNNLDAISHPLLGLQMPVQMRHARENYGNYRANSKTHKRYLRQNHLGKFKKGRTK